jgi:hypothetical protein
MHVPINVKSPNNISKWQVGFNSAFKGLILFIQVDTKHPFVIALTNGRETDFPMSLKWDKKTERGGEHCSWHVE